MFIIEHATAEASRQFIPLIASLMAYELNRFRANLEDLADSVRVLGDRGFASRVICPCLDLAIAIAKEDRRHVAHDQPQQLS